MLRISLQKNFSALKALYLGLTAHCNDGRVVQCTMRGLEYKAVSIIWQLNSVLDARNSVGYFIPTTILCHLTCVCAQAFISCVTVLNCVHFLVKKMSYALHNPQPSATLLIYRNSCDGLTSWWYM